MIAFIEGILEEAQPLKLIVNVGGIGYEIHTPLTSSAALAPVGQKVKLLTQLVVREDSQTLYGFLTNEEKSAFVALTEKVSGIGPKIALNILSRLSVDSLQSAVLSGNVALLTQCPGIGKKTAERLVLELKDLFQKSPLTSSTSKIDQPGAIGTAVGDMEEDAVAALVTLGFKLADANKRVAKAVSVSSQDQTVASIIKKALNG